MKDAVVSQELNSEVYQRRSRVYKLPHERFLTNVKICV